MPVFNSHDRKFRFMFVGKVYTIGRAEYGRLGLGEDSGEKREPTLVKTLTEKCTDIAAGQSVSLALTEDGKLYTL